MYLGQAERHFALPCSSASNYEWEKKLQKRRICFCWKQRLISILSLTPCSTAVLQTAAAGDANLQKKYIIIFLWDWSQILALCHYASQLSACDYLFNQEDVKGKRKLKSDIYKHSYACRFLEALKNNCCQILLSYSC